MKKDSRKILIPFFALLLLLQQGCVKDICTDTKTYIYYEPVYNAIAEVRANIKSNAPKEINNPGKIYIKGNYIFLNEIDKGIHVINNSNPAKPVNVSFIDIPGNVDIAVKENTLYADFYADLVTIDISDPLNIVVVKFVNNIFQERNYYGYNTDSGKVITSWTKKTETIQMDCNIDNPVSIQGRGVLFNSMDAGLASSFKASASPVGISGSLARFALIDDYLYSVSSDSLRITDVSATQDPVRANAIFLGWGIETIYPFKDKLFMGSVSGMFIYSVQTPLQPQKLGSFAHVRTCDPVIADDDFAYVTLHSGSTCAGFTNQMDVLNISDILQPKLLKTYPLTNPRGLSKDKNLLFVCDGNDGLKVFNAANANAIVLLRKFGMEEANDVIAYNNIALVVAGNGLYQYDYSNAANIRLLSKIPIKNN